MLHIWRMRNIQALTKEIPAGSRVITTRFFFIRSALRERILTLITLWKRTALSGTLKHRITPKSDIFGKFHQYPPEVQQKEYEVSWENAVRNDFDILCFSEEKLKKKPVVLLQTHYSLRRIFFSAIIRTLFSKADDWKFVFLWWSFFSKRHSEEKEQILRKWHNSSFPFRLVLWSLHRRVKAIFRREYTFRIAQKRNSKCA